MNDAPPPSDFLPFLESVIRRHLQAGRKPEHLAAKDVIEEALRDYHARVLFLATANTSYAKAFRSAIAHAIHSQERDVADDDGRMEWADRAYQASSLRRAG